MSRRRRLFIQQSDRKVRTLVALHRGGGPTRGWLHGIRTGLGMTLDQVARRLGVTRQNVSQIEKRESDGSITLNSLRDTANAMDLELFYMLVPKDGSLEALVDRRSRELATQLVISTHQTMKLEGQELSDERLKAAIEEQADELRRTMPKQLWD